MKTILISGINGFLGSNLAIALYKSYNVIGIERDLNNLDRVKKYNFKIYSSSTDKEIIFIENKIFTVIHTATIYKTDPQYYNDLIYTNIILPIELYRYSEKYGVNSFINTDSFFNNSDYNYSYLSEYITSKRHSLEWLKMINISSKCRLINIKLFHMFGENDNSSKFVTNIFNRILNNENTIDLTDGTQKRDFIYINDVVNAYKTIIHSLHKIGEKNIEYEIGSGNSITIREFVCLIKKISNSKSVLKFGKLKMRKGEIMDSKANLINIKKLGWNQNYPLEIAIQNMINCHYKN